MAEPIAFTIDGRAVSAQPGETLFEVAAREGIAIPHLCHGDGLRPDGNCRACVVEVQGERALTASCCRQPTPGMSVATASARALHARRLVVELLCADRPAAPRRSDSKLDYWAREVGVGRSRFSPGAPAPAPDRSHAAITVNLDACIHCTRCLRACREVQVNDVIGFAYRGPHSKIVFDLDDAMGASSCVACGECVRACPTGALMPAQGAPAADRTVDSVCPYCGVGCQLTYHVKDERIVHVEGRDGPSNAGRLCVKGRYGFDYVHHRQRLTRPLIRKPGVPKRPDHTSDPDDLYAQFREASWEEALAVASGGLRAIRDRDGPQALAGFGSAKGSNEEAYLFQKLVRTGFRTNNVDHCTRLCHASSVAALLEGLGSGAVSNPVRDVAQAEVVLVIGANPVVNHPVAATWIKNAVKAGTTKLIIADPRRSELARHATHYLQFRPDSDVALLNAMLHVIVAEGLVDEDFIRDRTSGYEALAANVAPYSPQAMAPVCGIAAETIRAVARLYATSRASMILWGMGVSQHVHGTDNARCLIALALSTGQIGRPGTGLHPLRGQNNVQGASDAGLIPMMYPDYQRVASPAAHAKFEQLWGTPLPTEPGLTVVEIIDAMHERRIRGLYVMGENPAMSDPDARHAREALARLEHLVVQDIFLTETAALADVVLPASAFPEKTGSFTNTDRTVQLGRQAIAPPGDARQDLWIIQQMARGIGLAWDYAGPEAVFDEMRLAMHSIAGITWKRLQAESAVTYPCVAEGDPGEPVIFHDHFPIEGGRGRFVPADIVPAAERPDADYPMILITGRQLEHWHTGTMTRRTLVLDAIEPVPMASLHPLDLDALGVAPGGTISVASRRGEVVLQARADDGTPRGAVFIPFCYYEAAANILTNPALDPVAKIPEFKYCAVRVTAGGDLKPRTSFGGGQLAAGRRGGLRLRPRESDACR
ncbi:MAG TPA: formate dehydrogenase subunit alpha [Burkholderiaceae bacterium]|nr:formate dehydrogenase subunit alpha [Burkholderiaceae bacterium]